MQSSPKFYSFSYVCNVYLNVLLCILPEAYHLEACNFPYTFETMLGIIPDQ